MPNSRKEAPIILAARGYRRKPSFAMAAVLDKEAVVGFVVHIELDCGRENAAQALINYLRGAV